MSAQARILHHFFGDGGQNLHVEDDYLHQVRTLHFDYNIAAVVEDGSVGLRKAGSGDGHHVEALVESFRRAAQFAFDNCCCHFGRELIDVFLQLCELEHGRQRQKVGSGRQSLSDFDEGRTELVEFTAQPAAKYPVFFVFVAGQCHFFGILRFLTGSLGVFSPLEFSFVKFGKALDRPDYRPNYRDYSPCRF